MNYSSSTPVQSVQREWRLLAVLPVVSGALLTTLLSLFAPRAWFLTFLVSSGCAYVSMFIGIVPLLHLSKRRNWQGCQHYALAGCFGTAALWIPMELAFNGFAQNMAGRVISARSVSITPSGMFVLLPIAVGALACIIFWLVYVRKSPALGGI